MFKKSILAILAMAGAFLPLGFVGSDAEEPVLTVLAASNKTWIQEWFSDPTVIWSLVVLVIIILLFFGYLAYLKKLDS